MVFLVQISPRGTWLVSPRGFENALTMAHPADSACALRSALAGGFRDFGSWLLCFDYIFDFPGTEVPGQIEQTPQTLILSCVYDKTACRPGEIMGPAHDKRTRATLVDGFRNRVRFPIRPCSCRKTAKTNYRFTRRVHRAIVISGGNETATVIAQNAVDNTAVRSGRRDTGRHPRGWVNRRNRRWSRDSHAAATAVRRSKASANAPSPGARSLPGRNRIGSLTGGGTRSGDDG